MTPSASTRADVAHRVFSAGRLSIGLTLPLLRSGHIVADFNEQLELAPFRHAVHGQRSQQSSTRVAVAVDQRGVRVGIEFERMRPRIHEADVPVR
ncbi:hypothetical protein QM334_20225, partial [Burkholderia cenocepacia]|nr:hypothetical protein [Burkholderia cenocepacia]